MKKLNFLLALGLAMLTGACSESGSVTDNIEYYPVQLEEDGDWGFIDKDGNLVVEDEFKESPSVVIDGIFSVKENDKIALYQFDAKKPVAVKGCEELLYAGFCGDGLIPVVYDSSRITLINKKGEKKFTLDPYKNKEITTSMSGYSDGMLAVYVMGEGWGYVDTKGKMVIEPKFSMVSGFQNGRAYVGEDKDGENVISFINKKGEKILSLRKGWQIEAYNPDEDYFYARDNNDKIVRMDYKGESEKCPSRAAHVNWYMGDVYVFSNEEGEKGVMDLEGEVIVRAKYESIYMYNGTIIANKEKETVLMDMKGEEKATIEDYYNVRALNQKLLLAKDKRTFQLFDYNGEEVKNGEYNSVSFELSASPYINSDFFSVETVANNVVGAINDKGMGKYTFGEPASKVFADEAPRRYSYAISGEISVPEAEGYRYSAGVQATFSEPIAQSQSSGYWSYTYSWNPGAKLEGFSIHVSAEKEMGMKGFEAFTVALKNKGFKQIEESVVKGDSMRRLFTKGQTVVQLFCSEGSAVVDLTYNKDPEGTLTSAMKESFKVTEAEPDSDFDEDEFIPDDSPLNNSAN